MRKVDKVDPQPQAKPGQYPGPRTFQPTRREVLAGGAYTTALAAGGATLIGNILGSKDPADDALTGGVLGAVSHEVARPIRQKLLTIALGEQEFRDIQSLIVDRVLYPDGASTPLVAEKLDPQEKFGALEDQYKAIRKEITPVLDHMNATRLKQQLKEHWNTFDETLLQAIDSAKHGNDAKKQFSMSIRTLQVFRDAWDVLLKRSRENAPDAVMESTERLLEQLESTISRTAGVSRIMVGGVDARDR